MNTVRILGIPFSPVTEESAAAILASHAAGSGPPFFAVTPNPLMVMQARKDPDFAAILCDSDLSLADGTGIVGAAKRAGTPLPGRATGIGTAEKTMELLASSGGSVYLLGGKPGVAEAAGIRLAERFPGLRIAGTCDGYFSEAEAPAAVRRISDAAPSLLCVCLGSPKQEFFVRKNRDALRCGAAVGLGGALDVWSGRLGRAPALFRKLRLEWLWRMLREPKRFRRLPDLVRFRLLTRKR